MSTQRMWRFLGKLLKRGDLRNRMKETEISAVKSLEGNDRGWCGNEEEGAGRQFSRMESSPTGHGGLLPK